MSTVCERMALNDWKNFAGLSRPSVAIVSVAIVGFIVAVSVARFAPQFGASSRTALAPTSRPTTRLAVAAAAPVLPKTGAPKPDAPKPKVGKPAPPAAPVNPIDKFSFFSLAGDAGIPAGFKTDGMSLADARGLNGNIRSADPDFVEHDFTFDVLFQFYAAGEREEIFFGIGEGKWAGSAGNSVCLHLHGPQYGDFAALAQIEVPQQQARDLGAIPKGSKGPWLLRLQKVKNTLTVAMGDAPAPGAPWEATFSKTIPDLATIAPFLDKRTARLFAIGGGTFNGVRLLVDGKPVVQAAEKPAGGAPKAEANALPPLFGLAGTAGIPNYLRATADALADADGIGTGILTTSAKDLVDHDFVFDIVYKFQDKQASIFTFGIGEVDQSGVYVRVHGPGHNGGIPIAVSGLAEGSLGVVGDSPGPHLIRMKKHGKAITFSVCADFKEKFEPTFEKTLPDVSAVAPFLTPRNSSLFVAIRGAVTVESVRLSIDGKLVNASASSAEPAAHPPATESAVKVANKRDSIDSVPFYYLANSNGLPPFLKADNAVLAFADGVNGGTCRTAATDLIGHDFAFDLLFEFKSDDDKEIFYCGIGEGATNDGGNLANSIGSRVHGPGHGGYGTFTIPGVAEQGIGIFGKSKGPHVIRLAKRGNTFTMAICADFTDTFKTSLSRTMPDLKSSAPFLTTKNSALFFAGNATFKAVRMTVDGKPAAQGKALAATAEIPKALTVPENFIRVKQASMPSFMEKPKDLKFTKDGEGGIVLQASTIRSKASDYLNKNFTFDIVYRPPPTDPGSFIVMGMGENRWDGNRLLSSLAVIVHGPGSDGLVEISIPGTRLIVVGKTGRDVGPHLLRLRKVGNSLSFAVWANYTNKPIGEPDGIKTIPDIRTADPSLTLKNSQLFVHGTGVVEQLRLVVEAQAGESQEIELSVPPRIVEGKPLKQPIIKPTDVALVKGRKFSLEAGPKGLTVSAAGDLSWVPTHEQVGRHDLKVRIEGAKDAGVVAEATIVVIAAEDAKAVNGDLAKVDALYRLPLAGETSRLVSGLDDTSMLLLEGAQLRRMGADGFTVHETLKLPKIYTRIGERKSYFVAVSDEGKCLDIIDKKTLEATRSIAMDYRTRFDLALNPRKPISYITVEKPSDDGLRSDILIVEELTGDVREPEDFIGRWIKVSPDGRRLYSAYTEIYEKGSRLLINPDHIHVIPEYGLIDLLIVYDVAERSPRPITVKDKVGGNSTGLELSRDGRRVSYLSHIGYPMYSNNIGAWDVTDLTKRPIGYSAKDHGAGPMDLAFHPMLPIVAIPSADGAICFDRETGAFQPDRVDVKSMPLPEGTTVHAARFSADGKNLILQCEDPGTKEYYFQKVKLRLSAQELDAIRTYKPPADDPPPEPRPVKPGPAPARA